MEMHELQGRGRRGSSGFPVYGKKPNSRTPLLHQHQQRRRSRSISTVEEEEEEERWRLRGLISATAGLVIFSALEQVLRKVIATRMYNYRWMFGQLVLTVTLLIAVSLFLINYKTILGRTYFAKLAFRSFFLMACLDTFHSLTLVLSIGVLPGPLSVILPQAIIPLSILFRFCGGNYFEGRQRCGTLYVVGSLVALAGVILTFLPGLLIFDPCVSEGSSRVELIYNTILLLCGVVAASCSALYKQQFLAGNNLNHIVLNLFISVFSFVLGLAMSPLMIFLQFVGSEPEMPHGYLSKYFYRTGHISPDASIHMETDLVPRNPLTQVRQGLGCLVGYNSNFLDACQSPLLGLVIGYLVITIMLQLSLTKVLQLTSSESHSHYALVSSVGVAFVAFQLPALQGLLLYPPGEDPGPFCFAAHIVGGAVLVIVGLVFCEVEQVEESTEVDIWALIESMDSKANKSWDNRLPVELQFEEMMMHANGGGLGPVSQGQQTPERKDASSLEDHRFIASSMR